MTCDQGLQDRAGEAERGASPTCCRPADNLGYTELKADEDGVITAVGADAGQVVSAGQMVVRLARPGEREAVFNVAEGSFQDTTRQIRP